MNASITGLASAFAGERFLVAKEAARYLLVHKSTVTRWARDGYIPAHPIGEGRRRLWRFLESELEEWLRSRKSGRSDPGVHQDADKLSISHRCSFKRRRQ